MSYGINEHCTACGECVAVCPNYAIAPAWPIYRINPLLCVECLGYADEPQCAAACTEGAVEEEPAPESP